MVEKILLVEMDDVFRKPDYDPKVKNGDKEIYCPITLDFDWDDDGYSLLKWYKSRNYFIVGVNCVNDWRQKNLPFYDRHHLEYLTLLQFEELDAIAFQTPLHGVTFHYQTRTAKSSISEKVLPMLRERFLRAGTVFPVSTAILSFAISHVIGKFAVLQAFDVTVIGKISSELYKDAERLGVKFLDIETVKSHVNALSKKKVRQ